MDIKEIKQVVDLMKRSELVEFEIEQPELKLRIKRDSKHAQSGGPVPMSVSMPIPATAQTVTAPATATAPAEPADEPGIEIIKSPMVGTFYRAPSPDSKVFVDVGDKVTADSVVCIIEAMKVMNEIQAEISGTITEVLIENGRSIEYGEPIFKVKTK